MKKNEGEKIFREVSVESSIETSNETFLEGPFFFFVHFALISSYFQSTTDFQSIFIV